MKQKSDIFLNKNAQTSSLTKDPVPICSLCIHLKGNNSYSKLPKHKSHECQFQLFFEDKNFKLKIPVPVPSFIIPCPSPSLPGRSASRSMADPVATTRFTVRHIKTPLISLSSCVLEWAGSLMASPAVARGFAFALPLWFSKRPGLMGSQMTSKGLLIWGLFLLLLLFRDPEDDRCFRDVRELRGFMAHKFLLIMDIPYTQSVGFKLITT